jgi:hypothetical protein
VISEGPRGVRKEKKVPYFLLERHKVQDYEKWKALFSEVEVQGARGTGQERYA